MMKQILKIVFAITCVSALTLLSGCAEPLPLKIYDGNEDSDVSKVENLLAQFIIENGYDNSVIYVAHSTNEAIQNLLSGSVDLVNANTVNDITADYKVISKAGNFYYLTSLDKSAPQIIAFLNKFKPDEEGIKESITFADEHSADSDAAVWYYLINNQSKWKTAVTDNAYEKAKEAVKNKIAESSLKNEF
ncbi:MAG: hypothetical protein O2897_05295 [bacterium]|nr:hypothetical protein [bacterium]